MDIRNGVKSRPPSAHQLPAADPTERWETLAASLGRLARPQRLVPTERGPGHFLSYAESRDGSTVALLAGDVQTELYARVSAPTVLWVDARTRRLLRRTNFPVQGGPSTFVGGRLELAPGERTLLVCFDEAPRVALWSLLSGELTTFPMPVDYCGDWRFSEDGTALLRPEQAWDIATGRRFALPFATEANQDAVTAALKRTPVRPSEAPPWLLCRVGPVLAPFDVCRQRFAIEVPSAR